MEIIKKTGRITTVRNDESDLLEQIYFSIDKHNRMIDEFSDFENRGLVKFDQDGIINNEFKFDIDDVINGTVLKNMSPKYDTILNDIHLCVTNNDPYEFFKISINESDLDVRFHCLMIDVRIKNSMLDEPIQSVRSSLFEKGESNKPTPCLFDVKPTDETIDEPKDETIDEPKDEIIDEPKDETIDEPKDETIDKPIDEINDEIIDEIIKEPTDEIIKEPINHTIKVIIQMREMTGTFVEAS